MDDEIGDELSSETIHIQRYLDLFLGFLPTTNTTHHNQRYKQTHDDYVSFKIPLIVTNSNRVVEEQDYSILLNL